MRVVTGRPARRSGWGLLRRCWPLAALVVAGLVVLASPGLQALLTALIWGSWLLVAFCAVTSSSRARQAGAQLLAHGRELGAALGSAVGRPLVVQARRLRTRVRGELTAGERS